MSEATEGQPEPVAWVVSPTGLISRRKTVADRRVGRLRLDGNPDAHARPLYDADVPKLIGALEAAESELIHKCRANIAIPCNCAARVVREALQLGGSS